VYPFGWSSRWPGGEIVPTNGRITRSFKKACERPPHAQWAVRQDKIGKLNEVASTYTLNQRIALAIVPRLASATIRLLGMTLRFEDVRDPGAHLAFDSPPPAVYAFWHRSLLLSAWHFRNHDIAILISSSFDGELIARTVARLGFIVVRGSSSRSGSLGLRNMYRAYRDGHYCAITADGPRGPAMVAKPGVTQLAQLVDSRVGTFYVLPERAWQLRSWDRFLIPKPFSRVFIGWPLLTAANEEAVQAALDHAVELAESRIGNPRK
jgi:lysophospholipid acyltransferase (LPLAT)-like uncharacterized protein